jgi:beta-lactamase regulating signal transducer with metallopeptidase domain
MNAIIASLTASIAGLMSTLLAQEVSPPADIQSIVTQLGIFGVVIAVFKFMLGRSDERDAKADKREEENIENLRRDIAILREELSKEQAAHEMTRQHLFELIRKRVGEEK